MTRPLADFRSGPTPLPRPVRPADPWVWAPPALALLLLAAVQLNGANTALFLWLNGLSGPTGDGLWTHATILGDGLMAFVLLLPWARRRPDVVWAGCLAAILATLWVHGLKPAFALPRPAGVLSTDLFHIIGPTYRKGSFPSGHATTAFALAGVFALSLASHWLRALLLACAAVVAVSRSVVGAHWPMDILAGMLGGWLAAALGLWWAQQWHWGMSVWGRRILTLLLLTAGVVLLSGHNTGYPEAMLLQQAIAVMALAAGLGAAVAVFRRQPGGQGIG